MYRSFQTMLFSSLALLTFVFSPLAKAESVTGTAFLSAYSSGIAPKGFGGLCGRYGWACSAGRNGIGGDALLATARRINREVNASVREQKDQQTFGKSDYWSLPRNGAGDCEDIALLKKKRLIDAGVAPADLMLALVIKSSLQTHVVLVVRTEGGDYIMDNLRSSLASWERSGYTFLKMQNNRNPRAWDSVLLGPLASRT